MTTYPSGELAGPGTLPFPFGLPRPGPASRPRPSARERARACGRGRVGKQRQQAHGGEARAPAPTLAPAPTRSARPSHDQGHPHLQQPREAAALQVLPALCEYAPAAEPDEGERRRRAAPGGFLRTTLAPPRPSRRPTCRAAGCQLGRWGAAATPRRPLAVSGRGGFSASRGAAHLSGTSARVPQPGPSAPHRGRAPVSRPATAGGSRRPVRFPVPLPAAQAGPGGLLSVVRGQMGHRVRPNPLRAQATLARRTPCPVCPRCFHTGAAEAQCDSQVAIEKRN